MARRSRRKWSPHIDEIIRSRHYTWLGHGLGGDNVEDAMTTLLADIMHICKRQGISWESVLERGSEQFRTEEDRETAMSN